MPGGSYGAHREGRFVNRTRRMMRKGRGVPCDHPVRADKVFDRG